MSERLLPQCPYLIEHTAVAPDITGRRVLAIVDSLRGRPLDWDFSSVGTIVLLILKVSRQSKVSNLKIISGMEVYRCTYTTLNKPYIFPHLRQVHSWPPGPCVQSPSRRDSPTHSPLVGWNSWAAVSVHTAADHHWQHWVLWARDLN